MSSIDKGKGKAKDTDSNLESQPKENTTREVPTLDMTRTLATIQAGDKRTSDQRSPQTPEAPPPKRRYDPVREDRFQEPRTGRYDPVREDRSYEQRTYEQRTYEQRTYEQRTQTETRYDPASGRYIRSGRPADHPRTTPAAPTSDAPTTPTHPPQFEQGSSSSSSEQSWRHPGKLKESLATKGKWDYELAKKIRREGGLTEDEITELRSYLKQQYGGTLTESGSNYNSEYKQHYTRVTNLAKKHLASSSKETPHKNFGIYGDKKYPFHWQVNPPK
jgi:hypothetical protein